LEIDASQIFVGKISEKIYPPQKDTDIVVVIFSPWDMFRFMYYQCKESDIEMPAWSKKWVNIRKSYCNFYHCGRGGIEVMLKNLGKYNVTSSFSKDFFLLIKAFSHLFNAFPF
jgi:inhibitor of KinA sporulation pathway (predicted exonuclease)